MRFDDRLQTVLAQPSADPHDCAVRWRQLVDLVARAGRHPRSPLISDAIAALKDDWSRVDEARRAAAARAIAAYPLPIELLALFAADSASVSAPVLAAARLEPGDWEQLLAEASSETRRFVATLHPELVMPPARRRPPRKEGDVRGAAGAREHPPQPPVPAAPAVSERTAQPVPSISDVIARIERVRRSRAPAGRPGFVAAPARPLSGSPALFRWECGPSGEIAWVEGAPRGALIGRSIARAEDEEGVDEHVERAFAMRAPFRDATLTLGGEGVLSGEWKISGIPAFEPNDGRFAGYRGVAMREGPAAAGGMAAAQLQAPLDPDTLRELVHEIKTPLNAIIGFAEIIDGQYLGPADTRYRERAAEIVGQARLLLAAIDDLDLAAKLQSVRDRTAAQDTDLAELFSVVGPEMAELAAVRGTELEIAVDPGCRCGVEASLVTRLLRRFLTAVIGMADADDRLFISADSRAGQCRAWIDRPGSLKRMREEALLDPAFGADGPGLPFGIALRLVRGLAGIAGGELVIEPGRLGLSLPAGA